MPDQLETIVQRMIDAGEPEENIATVIKGYTAPKGNPRPISAAEGSGAVNPLDPYIRGFGEGARGGAVGFVKGVGDKLLHPLNTVGGMVKDVAGEAGGTLLGAGRLVTDPANTLSNAGSAIKQSVTEDIPNAINNQIDLAGRDPEAFGRGVGQATATTDAGIALGGGLRYAPRPMGRTVGGLMEAVGKKAEWPIRMMGAHQIGSGNPAGLLMIGMPEILKAGGQKLGQWGRAEPAYQAAEIEKFNGPAGAPIRTVGAGPSAPAPDDDLFRMGMEANKVVPKGKAGMSLDPDAAALAEAQRRYPNAKIVPGSVAPVTTPKGTLTAAIAPAEAPLRPPIRIAPETTQRLSKTPLTPDLASKSGNAMSATPGLTVNDAQALGINPNVRITGLTPEAIQKLLAERAAREAMYRANAGLDAGFRRATEE